MKREGSGHDARTKVCSPLSCCWAGSQLAASGNPERWLQRLGGQGIAGQGFAVGFLGSVHIKTSCRYYWPGPLSLYISPSGVMALMDRMRPWNGGFLPGHIILSCRGIVGSWSTFWWHPLWTLEPHGSPRFQGKSEFPWMSVPPQCPQCGKPQRSSCQATVQGPQKARKIALAPQKLAKHWFGAAWAA